jgi:4'-phosphopantetheinyl transferase EntD
MFANTTPADYAIAFARYSDHTRVALTSLERPEFDALSGGERRRDWLAGRCAAKQVIAERTGRAESDIALVARPHAAPRCLARNEGGWTELPVDVSIAHRDGWAVAAVSGVGVRVGLDLERAQGLDEAHARYFLSPGEAKAAEMFGPSLLWVVKEAAWKALGLDDSFAFTDLALAITRTGCLNGVFLRGVWLPARARTWTLRSGLVAAALCIAQVSQ